jgi:hypothetical protein
MNACPELIDEMVLNEELLNARWIQITPDLLLALKDFSSVVSMIISGAQLLFLTRVDHYRESS